MARNSFRGIPIVSAVIASNVESSRRVELAKAGALIALDGVHPSSKGARVTFSGGKPKVTDGPFSEAKEVIGGYWMIQAKSKEEAVGVREAASNPTVQAEIEKRKAS